KDRKPVAAALKDIYRAVNAAAAETALTAFEEGSWGQKYPAIGQSWRRAWGEVVPFYAFPGDVRRILYTTNAIEALNSKLRRAVRARGHFPSDEAAMKLLFLVLNRAEKEWIMPPREWCRPRRSSPFSSASALHEPWIDQLTRSAAHEIPDSPPPWVVSRGGSAQVSASTLATVVIGTGAVPGSRVLSCRSPSTPSSA